MPRIQVISSELDVTAAFLDDMLFTTEERSQDYQEIYLSSDDEFHPDSPNLNVDADFIPVPESLCRDIDRCVELFLGLLCKLVF